MSSKKKILIYLFFVLSLLTGYFFNENASGGAELDQTFLKPFIQKFSINFFTGMDFYLNNDGSKIHSPAFYLIIAPLLTLFQNFNAVNIFYLLICSLLPYIFFLVLKNKTKSNSGYIFLVSILIFISPYFRSSAIWMLGDNLSLLFFCVSIYFYSKIENDKKNFLYYFLCLFFLICCCYIRYYYAVFYLFYIFYFYNKISVIQFTYLIIFSFLISIPALYYFYYIFIEYNFGKVLNNYTHLINFYSNTLQILSILFFYLFPFVVLRLFNFISYYKNNLKIINIFFLVVSSFLLVDTFIYENLINISISGGGIFKKLAELLDFSIPVILSFFSLISLLILDFVFKENRVHNYILLIILITCFPLTIIYQKYLDPLFFLFFFGLVRSNFILDALLKRYTPIIFLFIYFGSFLLFSIIYYN
mgnify:CR=1 FL=1